MKNFRVPFFVFFSLLIFSLPCTAKEKKNILYLNSYHDGYQWSDTLLEGIRSVLDTSQFKVDLQIEYMDVKKYNYELIKGQLFTLFAEKFKNEHFDVIIISDNDAVNFITTYGQELFPGAPVIFCGVNGLDTIDVSGGNITGVIESFDLIRTVEVARSLHPGKNRMVVIGDQSTAGLAIEKQAKFMMASYDHNFEVEFWSDLSLEETLQRVKQLPEDTFLFFSPWYQMVGGKFFTSEEVMAAISDNSSVPIYTAWEFLLGHGTVGGRMLSGLQHGSMAATMALQVLKGTPAGTIPIVTKYSGEDMFDYKVLKRLDVDTDLLPANAIIINSPKAFYELSKELLWTIVVSFFLLFFALISLVAAMIGRRKVERKVLEQLSFQETLMDTIPQLVSWKDTSGIYLGANRSFVEFFDVGTLENVVNRTTHGVLADPDYTEWSVGADLAVVNNQGALRKVRRKIIDHHGHQGWLEVNKVPLRDQAGKIVGILTTAENVTKEQNLETQLLQSQKMEAIGTLAGGIAHDFNNILTSIINSTELAIGDIDTGTQTEKDLQRVLKAARRGSRVVKQILSFSRPSQEGFRPTNIGHLIQEVLSLIDVSLPSNIVVQTNVDTQLVSINASPTQIHQALLNLCTNAFHALRDTGGTLDIHLQEVELDIEEADTVNIAPGPYAKITVSDNGPGISPDILDKIFDPFFSTKGKADGTGLGLAVVHGIVKAHRGGLKMESEVGKGTVFTVFLPRSVEAHMEQVTPEIGSTKTSLVILFVEDDEDQLNSTPRILRDIGHTVTAVSDPLAAAELLKRMGDTIDLVITDYDMPNMSGVELSRVRPSVPVLLISGREDAVLAAKKSDTIRQVLIKPYDKEGLRTAINTTLYGE